MISAYSCMNKGAHLSEDGSHLSLVGIGWGLDDLLEGDGHILEDNVETIVSCESVEGRNDVTVPNVSEHVERLLGRWLRERSYMNELNRRRLSNRHLNGATKFKVVNLLVPRPRRFPCRLESEGVCYRRSVRSRARRLQGILSWRAGSLLI